MAISISTRDEALAHELDAALARVLTRPPVSHSDDGLMHARKIIERRLRGLGFEISHHGLDGHPPIVVALRAGTTTDWIGIAGHYDVEAAGTGWTTSAFTPTRVGGRIVARGVADNLGPLLLRLIALELARDPLPSIAWVLQGEEERGSPAAHRIFPSLDLPPAALWLEETGYYEVDGRQRMLLRRPSETTGRWIDAAFACATSSGRTIDVHDRYMNKAFGADRCPFLSHLVGDATYLAIGPNDPLSNVHQADESLAVANLAASVDQFLALLEAATA